MRQQRKSGRGFWFGLTVGVALGVAFVILFLPRPSDTRQATRARRLALICASVSRSALVP